MRYRLLCAAALTIALVPLAACELFAGTQRLGCDAFGADLKLEHDPARAVDYVIDCLVELDGVELEVLEGTVIELEAGAGLKIGPSARVSMVSVQQEPIVLRGTEEGAGHWRGLRVESAGGGRTALQNVHITDVGAANDPDFPGAITVVGQLGMLQVQLDRVAGVGVWVEEGGRLTDFAGCTVTGCGGHPVRVPPDAMDHLEIDNSLTGNQTDRVLVAPGVLDENAIILDQGIPYEISGDVDITAHVNLSGPVEWRCADAVRVYVTGSFTTSWDDHAVISALSERPGAWHGITLNIDNSAVTEGPLKLYNLTIEYGGGGPLFPANLSIERGRVDVKDAVIQHSASCGIRYDQSAAELRDQGNNLFIDNAEGGICTD